MTEVGPFAIGKVHHADCLEGMRQMPDACVTAVVTDPPYGIDFMGKDWDHGVPGVAFWTEALRVAKPGAPLLAFGGTRTFHRLAVAIEDAGWEIRDCLMWVYGSGFPKSLDISKAIDKAAGAERDVVGLSTRPDGTRRPNQKNWENGKKTYAQDKWTQENFSSSGGVVTNPTTDEAKKWDGYGTALKPAWEPIILAMKPFDGTFAKNAQEHGVSGLNIEGGRVSISNSDAKAMERCNTPGSGRMKSGKTPIGTFERSNPSGEMDTSKGRWPANVVLQHHPECALKGTKRDEDGNDTVDDLECHTECPVRLMDEQSGETLGSNAGGVGDIGGASRFFYCAKASKKERGPTNEHPTVKPLDLMKWLVNLVKMPDDNLILDPFSGSGTTGFACEFLHVPFVGFEKDERWVAVGNRRIRSVTYGDVSVKEHKRGQRSLFGDIE